MKTIDMTNDFWASHTVEQLVEFDRSNPFRANFRGKNIAKAWGWL